MMDTKTEDIIKDDIGATLKTQRQKLGHSLEDAARYTRIRKTYLVSLESNQFTDLPGQVYVTGFVRVYAQFLQMDAAALLIRLNDVDDTLFPPLKPPTAAKYQTYEAARPGGSGWSAFVLGLVVVLILGGAVYFLSTWFFSSDDVVPAPVVAEPVVEKEPITEIITEGDKEASAGLPSVPDTVKSEMIADEAPEQPVGFPAVKPNGSSLRMLALSKGSLIINLDERKAHQYKLFNGLDLTWKIKSKAAVEMNEPGIAHFWLDGQELNLAELALFQLQQDVGE